MKKFLYKICAESILFFILGLRPFLGPASCLYTVSCTHFARYQLETQPLIKALGAILRRLLACHPFALRRF